MVRIVTYNVHRCVGVDGRLDVGRTAAVIAALAPDIVALQEVDVGRRRTGRIDQAHELADRLGMAFQFNAAFTVEEERYGDAILARAPQRLVKAGPLPGHPLLPRLEPRGALWTALELEGIEVQVITTHLGLVPKEQQIQAAALVGRDWLGASRDMRPLLLAGDFNATARTVVYRTLTKSLAAARAADPQWNATATFPSRWPLLALDHVFIGPGVAVAAVRAPWDPLARVASDHLPLAVDVSFDLSGPAAPSRSARE
jgi:endonuclease/exonuclease/phosphatase family metal-dependent hydrolase